MSKLFIQRNQYVSEQRVNELKSTVLPKLYRIRSNSFSLLPMDEEYQARGIDTGRIESIEDT